MAKYWLMGIIIYFVSAFVVYMIIRYQHGPKGDRQNEVPSLRHLFFTVVPGLNTITAVIVILSIVSYGIDVGDLSHFFGVKTKEEREQEKQS